jgi:hypothetical protein
LLAFARSACQFFASVIHRDRCCIFLRSARRLSLPLQSESSNAEARRKLAAASFYVTGSGNGKKKKGNKKQRELPADGDFGEAGWVGGPEQGKPKKNGKPKAAVPTYNTAGQSLASSKRGASRGVQSLDPCANIL